MSQPIAVVATVDAKPDCVAQVEDAIRICVTKTRKEPGCILYNCHTDLNVSGRFVFIEQWKSLEALAEHEKMPHFLTLAETLKSLLAAPAQVAILQGLKD